MRRVQRKDGIVLGQIRVLLRWITVKRFTDLSDAVKWLGYDNED
jgi:hypothetical protein